jgi:carboxyl-terminal processing protease
LNAFQQMLESYNADVLVFAGNAPNQDNAVGDFTIYFLGTHPTIAKNFVVDDGVIRQLREFLTKRNIRYTDQDIADNLDWIKLHIKREVFTSVFGQLEGYRVEAEGDPEILKGAELIPQARALYENARRIIAERTSPSLNRPMLRE